MNLDALDWLVLDYTRVLSGKFVVVCTMTIRVCNNHKLGVHEFHVDLGKYTLHTITIQEFIYTPKRGHLEL